MFAQSDSTVGYDWPDKRQRVPLPVDAHLSRPLHLFERHQIIVGEAETGAGKTLRFGQALVLSNPFLHVWHTQPRRNALRWNGRRICYELGCNPGELVGWRLRGEESLESPATRLHLRVDRSLINSIIRNDGRLPEGIIIVDEAHERSVNGDMLLGLIYEALPRSPRTKLLIISATIDTQKFSKFFGDAPVISIKGRNYPVRTEVLYLMPGEHHSEGAARAAEMVLNRFQNNELTIPTEDGNGEQKVSGGTVLVYLPGAEDIRNVVASIQDWAKANEAQDRIEALQCHGDSTVEEQDRVHQPLGRGVLRFVVGTEILRSSITIATTIGGIDSLQIKRNLVNAEGVSHLTKIAVSRAEAEQGRGRAGRTGPGFYIAVSYNDEYYNLEPYPQPAVQREAITSVALQTASIDRSIRDFPWIDAPDQERVETAIRRLKLLDALDKNEQITDIGYQLADFSSNPEIGKAMLTANHLGVLLEVVILAAVQEGRGFFHLPKAEGDVVVSSLVARVVLSNMAITEGGVFYKTTSNSRDVREVSLSYLPNWMQRVPEGGYKISFDFNLDNPLRGPREVATLLRRYWAGESRSDFVAVVRAYRAYKAEQARAWQLVNGRGEPLSPQERHAFLRTWCHQHFLNHRGLRQTDAALLQIRQDLEGSSLHLNGNIAVDRAFDAEALTKSLLSGLVDNVGALQYQSTYKSPLGDFLLANSSACAAADRRERGDLPQIVLVGNVSRVGNTTGRFGRQTLIADPAAPVKPEWLTEMVPQLCTVEDSGVFYDPDLDEVMQNTQLQFQGIELGERLVRALDKNVAAWCFAEWLAEQEGASILPAIKAQQDRARFLNSLQNQIRFKVWGQLELTEFLRERLAGARSLKDVCNPQALSLPPLDESQIQEVTRNYPPAIELLGAMRAVQYSHDWNGSTPWVVLPAEVVTSLKFVNLSDVGVCLVDGTPVQLAIEYEGRTFDTGRDIPELKRQVTKHLRNKIWEAWHNTHQGDQAAKLDPADPSTVIPEIVERVYGACPVTRESLVAYGTYGTAPSLEEGPFAFFWYPTHEHAQLKQGGAEGLLRGLRLQLREEQERGALMPDVVLLKELLAVTLKEYSKELPQNVKTELGTAIAEDLSSAKPEKISKWLETTWELAIRADAAGSYERQLEQECVLRDFGGEFQLMGNKGRVDYWVVMPDGSLRVPNEFTAQRRFEGRKIWSRISKRELALSWRLLGRATTPMLRVHHKPEGGCTAEQRVAVAHIEKEIGVQPGSFGLG